QLTAEDAKYPQQRHNFDPADFVPECAAWNVKGAPAIEKQPVTSDLPALVMEGTYDPITPPDFGKDTPKYLKNSFYTEYPGLGTGTSVGDNWPLSVALAFLDDPTKQPDTSCIGKMTGPQWVVGQDNGQQPQPQPTDQQQPSNGSA